LKKSKESRTAIYLSRFMDDHDHLKGIGDTVIKRAAS
jgi:hypothetical protein